MPGYLKLLAGIGLGLTTITFMVMVFGPQEGLETLGGGLLAYFCFLYHLFLTPFFLVWLVKAGRVTPGAALLGSYLLLLVGSGLYQVVLINDLDEAARDLYEAQTEPASQRIRELGRTLYFRYQRGEAIPEADRFEWQALVSQARTLNRRDRHHAPALWYAAAMGDADMVERLLGAGAAPDDPALYGIPPLAAAIEEGHVDVVRRLITGGADPNAGLNKHYPSLSLAARKGHLQLLEALIEAGANPNLGDPVPFTVALANGRAEMLAALLDAGAQPALIRGELPLLFALEEDDPALVKVLLEKADGFELSIDDRDPLLFLVVSGCDLAALQRYLALGADPDVRNRKAQPLLAHAALLRTRGCDLDAVRDDLVSALIEAGAAVDVVNERGEPLLLQTLRQGHGGVASAMVGAGAGLGGEIAKRDFLMLAAGAGRDDLIEVALGRGFDINRRSEGMNGSCAICEAARAGHAGTVRFLIERGARLPEADVDRRNLFRFAAEHPESLHALAPLYISASEDGDLARLIRRSVEDSGNAESLALLDAAISADAPTPGRLHRAN